MKEYHLKVFLTLCNESLIFLWCIVRLLYYDLFFPGEHSNYRIIVFVINDNDLSECLTEGGSVVVSYLPKSEEKKLDILFQ